MVKIPVDASMQFISHPRHRFDGTIVKRLIGDGLFQPRNHCVSEIMLSLARQTVLSETEEFHPLDRFIKRDASRLGGSGLRPGREWHVRLQPIAFGTDRGKICSSIRRSRAFARNDMVHFARLESDFATTIKTLALLPLYRFPPANIIFANVAQSTVLKFLNNLTAIFCAPIGLFLILPCLFHRSEAATDMFDGDPAGLPPALQTTHEVSINDFQHPVNSRVP